jgi:hypothetical protein
MITSCTPPGTNVKLFPLFNLPKNVLLSTGKALVQEYTCRNSGILNMAEVIKHAPSSLSLPGRRRRNGEKADCACGNGGLLVRKRFEYNCGSMKTKTCNSNSEHGSQESYRTLHMAAYHVG